MVSFVFVVDILQLPHTVISNSEKLTHPTMQYLACVPGVDWDILAGVQSNHYAVPSLCVYLV